MPLLDELGGDLEAETTELLVVLDRLGEDDFERPSAAEGWTIRDCVTHLSAFDRRQIEAVVDPEGFAESAAEALSTGRDIVEEARIASMGARGTEAVDELRTARSTMIDLLVRLDPKARIEWYGPPMSPASALTARLMETWAHGQDVRDVLGIDPAASDRLRHVALLGLRARPFAYALRGKALPDADLCVELVAPEGGSWELGDPSSGQRIEGSAVDFCLLVTQRRHRSDTDLVATGGVAEEFLEIAQAFAGPVGAGRQPRRGRS